MNEGVLSLLSELDPWGFEPGGPDGCPDDEYSPEAGPMARILIRDGTIDIADIDAIWTTWFGEPLSRGGRDERLERFVADLNALHASLTQPESTG